MGRNRVSTKAKDHCSIALDYARKVVAEKIPACRWVRLACQRQIDDLDRKRTPEKPWPWKFDKAAANKACKFVELLPHIKGRWSSKTIVLEAWQCFILTTIFGWVDSQGLRRFKTVYIEVPRKNAKTTIGAAICLLMLCADGEPGAEVYSAAVTRDQAKISWETSRQMVKRDPEMRDFFGVEPLAHSIVTENGASYFKPLARDADSLEGLSPHCALVDELHAHKTREVWDVLNVARGSRRNSLLVAITTAGENREGVCFEQRAYVLQILQERHEDDRYFGIVYGIDADDDWTKVETHQKANPNFGVSVMPDDMAMLCRQAERSADSQNAFLTKRLNVWVTAGASYFNMLAWDQQCKDPDLKIEDFIGEPCITTIDLASKSDLTDKVMVFERESKFYVFASHYLPSDAIERGKENYDFYQGWSNEKLLKLTEGNITDYAFLEREVLADQAKYRPRRVGTDPNYNAGQFMTRMQAKGVPVVQVPQTTQNLSEPMQELAALIISGRIRHNGDPVLAWMMGNVIAKRNEKGDVYPRKERHSDKIDGAVALIGNIGLWARERLPRWDGRIVVL